MHREVLGHVQLRLDDRLDLLEGDGRGHLGGRALQGQLALASGDDVLRCLRELRVIALGSGLLEDALELLLEVLEGLLRLLDGDVAASDEAFGVVLSHGSL